MPSIRSGFGSDFVLKNEKIGIGSETPTNTLDVDGAIKGNLSIAGVATLTSYGGFVAQNQHINKASSIGFATVGVGTLTGYYETETGFTDLGGVHHGDDQYYNTLSEDLVIDEGQILNITSIDMVGFTTIGEYDPHSHQSHVCLGALEEVSVTNHFSVPNGGSNDRKDNPIEGTVRFNTDLNTLEFFNGNEWRQFTYNQGQSGRGVFGAGWDASNNSDNLQSIQLTTLGNSVDFGTLVEARRNPGGRVSSSIRGFIAGGYTTGQINRIDSWTFASGGKADDFGNLLSVTHAIHNNGVASSSRGIWAGGQVPSGRQNVIQYIEMGTFGDTLDFGDLNNSPNNGMGVESPVRGLFCGGQDNPLNLSIIDGITIASKGDAVNFGDLTKKVLYGGSVSSGTRGVIAGGEVVPSPAFTATSNTEYITISSAGRGFDFGELTSARSRIAGMETSTRGVFAGSVATGSSNTFTNVIDYVNIASTGNAQDFGDITNGGNYQLVGCSDSHGGLGGF